MPLASGTKIGPYEIASLLGVGGMGEVYRSRDSKLGREVALKVLPTSVAIDPDRLGRFSREAKVLAALNHPNIATIYGLEDFGATHAIVMELVEGPTLADRIRSGPMPSEEALPIAKQICEALEYAHERGIVHRDLKPANIKVTEEGAAKVLDFGLAKALEIETGPLDIASSPTMSRAATQAGMILGTAAYMSPEQARGKRADRRSDIWAFGCVLYEMLTGKMVFSGETVSDTLADIIKEQPDWSRLPAGTSARVRVLLQRCLTKDPRQRLQAIGDARIAIEEVLSGAPEPTYELKPQLVTEKIPAWKRWLPWGIAAALTAALLFSLFALRKPAQPATLVQLSLTIPQDQTLEKINGPAMAISPDGSRIAYVTQQTGSTQGRLYVREIGKREALLLEGAGLAAGPFFSPDSQWIGFFGDGKLKKVSVHGGAPIALADVAGYRGGTWGDDDTIIFPTQYTSALYRIPAGGGTAQQATHLDSARSEITHRWPQFLPGAKAVLYTASANNNFFGTATVQVTILETGETRILVPSAYFGRYLPGGYLAYFSQNTLFVVPFDAQSLKITGTAIPVLQDVDSDITNGGAQFSVSESGTAIYLAGGSGNQSLNIAMVDRKGNASLLVKDQSGAASPRLSPDGKKLVFEKGGLWIHDLSRGTTTPFSVKSATVNFPLWTPDGQRLAYSYVTASEKGLAARIFWNRSDGTDQEKALSPADGLSAYPSSWSPDGKVLAFLRTSGKTGACCAVWTMRIGDDGKAQEVQPFTESTSGGSDIENGPSFSPDGHWLAYSSIISGLGQIFVAPYPGSGGKVQVSTDGGYEPHWSKSGHELFYIHVGGLVSVPYSLDKSVFQPGKPQTLFGQIFEMRAPYASYDVAADGQHFVMLQTTGGRSNANIELTVVLNWLGEVRRQVASGQAVTGK